ncbi:HD domain-containing protein [Curtobacterium sp. MCPF17_021]|uniref:HD domain-containing protein n=1 Tax=Curtobacterium sp. MCPF17_021 TaxID=2175639 RepID=UPI000DA92994|nr:HD domain-containing protein [Curtobacterium sp. MCPF17_021]WIE82816.1 HD domain-containing protein [Curtobacterium sp. MCPF17_021]
MTKDLVRLAHSTAARAHAGQVDKVGRLYIEHPTAVAEPLTTEDQQVVGFLHDVVEDTDITLAELRALGFTAPAGLGGGRDDEAPGGDTR